MCRTVLAFYFYCSFDVRGFRSKKAKDVFALKGACALAIPQNNTIYVEYSGGGKFISSEEERAFLLMETDGSPDDSAEYKEVLRIRGIANRAKDMATMKSRMSPVDAYIRQQIGGQIPA
jgi:hypothetical protein